MITIIKGEERIVCTKNTFEEQYKPLGYQIASKKKEATKQVASIIKEENKENQEKEKINEKYKLKEKKGGK